MNFYPCFSGKFKVFGLLSLLLFFIACRDFASDDDEPTRFTVTFDLNYGEGTTPDAQTIAKNSKASKPADPTRTDYTFDGWYDAKTDGNRFAFDTTKVTESITLFARWTKEMMITVTFDLNDGDGTAPDPQSIAKNSKANKPVDPTRTDYTFDGWYDAQTDGNRFAFGTTKVTESITLFARWTAVVVTVTATFDPKTSIGMQIPTKSDLGNLTNVPESLQMTLRAIAGDTPKDYGVIFVSPNGAGAKDGTTQQTAYSASELKTAIDKAGTDATNTKPYLVVVAPGTYAVASTLNMKNNVVILGGLTAEGGLSETKFDGGGSTQVFNNTNLDRSAVLYGITITKGSSASGGGMYNDASSPTLTQVAFVSNASTGSSSRDGINGGGGMYNGNASSPILTQVTFSKNTANSGGGGMLNSVSSPILIQVTFSENTAALGGGVSSQGNLVMTQVTFVNNKTTHANGSGGGLYVAVGLVIITNSIFWGNTARDDDGAQLFGHGFGIDGLQIYGTVVQGSAINTGDQIAGTATVVMASNTSNADPKLSALSSHSGSSVQSYAIQAGSSAIDIGLYVKRHESTLYYSDDNTNWYTLGFTSDGYNVVKTNATPPADAIDLTAKDITNYPRSGKPDAGTYESR